MNDCNSVNSMITRLSMGAGKVKLSLTSTVLLLVITTGATVFALNTTNTTTADEKPPIVQEVERHSEVLDNHEDRISNTEKDVADLQNNTGTPPSIIERVVVREVTTQKPSEPLYTPPGQVLQSETPEPEPTPEAPKVIKSVANFKVLGRDAKGNEKVEWSCQYTYSDGSVKNEVKGLLTWSPNLQVRPSC